MSEFRDFIVAVVISIIVFVSIGIGAFYIRKEQCYQQYSDFEQVEFGLFKGCRVMYNGKMWPVERLWAERMNYNVE